MKTSEDMEDVDDLGQLHAEHKVKNRVRYLNAHMKSSNTKRGMCPDHLKAELSEPF